MNPFKIAKRYGCSVGTALKKIYAVREAAMPFEEAWENDLFYMTPGEIRRYLSSDTLRMYSQLVAQSEDTTEYEAYRQIRRALKEFGIPYATFNREKLFNASDDVMASVKSKQDRKKRNAVKKIAKAANISFDEAQNLAADLKKRYGVNADFCYTHQLYNKSDEQIKKIVDSKSASKSAKINAALKETGWTRDQLMEHAAKCSQKFRIGNDYYYSLKCYNLSDEQLEGVLVHTDIHKLSAMMNKHPNRVDDKGRFCANFKEHLGRKSWANSDSNFEEFERFADGLDEIFVKPVDGMHGTGARKISLAGADLRSLYDELMSEKALVAEEVIVQHPDMAAFNPTSINTVRIYTIQDGDSVDIVNAYARFGNGGIIDNYSSGGLECGVDPKTGQINTPALCKTGEVFDEHPITHIAFVGFQIPLWDEAVSRVSSAIKVFDDINLVGWDVAITPNGTLLVEGNTDPGPGAFQRFLVENGISMRERFSKYLERLE